MSTTQLAGILLVAGTLSFWLGAALPTWRVYVTADPNVRVQLITDLHGYWILSHILFLAGAIATAVGLGVFTSTIEASNARPLALIGLGAIALASVIWAYSVLAFRLSMPPDEFVRTSSGAWTFPTYTLLTLGALILYGIVLLVSGFPTWLGIVTVGISSLILVAFLIQRDAVPAAFYIPTLIMGIAFLT